MIKRRGEGHVYAGSGNLTRYSVPVFESTHYTRTTYQISQLESFLHSASVWGYEYSAVPVALRHAVSRCLRQRVVTNAIQQSHADFAMCVEYGDNVVALTVDQVTENLDRQRLTTIRHTVLASVWEVRHPEVDLEGRV
ncbi:hypothetical protein D3C71_1745810 [compost metagenome]